MHCLIDYAVILYTGALGGLWWPHNGRMADGAQIGNGYITNLCADFSVLLKFDRLVYNRSVDVAS